MCKKYGTRKEANQDTVITVTSNRCSSVTGFGAVGFGPHYILKLLPIQVVFSTTTTSTERCHWMPKKKSSYNSWVYIFGFYFKLWACSRNSATTSRVQHDWNVADLPFDAGMSRSAQNSFRIIYTARSDFITGSTLCAQSQLITSDESGTPGTAELSAVSGVWMCLHGFIQADLRLFWRCGIDTNI